MRVNYPIYELPLMNMRLSGYTRVYNGYVSSHFPQVNMRLPQLGMRVNCPHYANYHTRLCNYLWIREISMDTRDIWNEFNGEFIRLKFEFGMKFEFAEFNGELERTYSFDLEMRRISNFMDKKRRIRWLRLRSKFSKSRCEWFMIRGGLKHSSF